MDALSLYRLGHWCSLRHVPLVPRAMQGLGMFVFSAAVPASAEIGRDTMLGYGGLGVVIHSRAVIGDNVLISPGVTVGGRSKSLEVPRIGDDVFVGSGAKILGDVEIGDGAVIGANAVVLHDVPARAMAVGVPAKVIRTDVDVSDYCRLPRQIRAEKHG